MVAFWNHPATVTRPGTRELRDGSRVPDPDHPEFVDQHDDLNVQPLTPEQEATFTGDVDTDRRAVQTRPGTFIRVQHGDLFEYRGNTYLVDGLVAEHYDPTTGREHHQEFVIARTIRGAGRG